MAYEIGTASDYKDLLSRLRKFISDPDRVIGDDPNMTELVAINSDIGSGEASQAWEVGEGSGDVYSRWNTNYDGNGNYELIACGPGSGSDQIFVGIQTYSNVGYYNWKLAGFTGYSPGITFANQPGVTNGKWPRMLMWNSTIKYWFVANGRRFIVVARTSTGIYECCYGGFALPYGLPTQFSYPLVIGGSSTGYNSELYSSQDAQHRAFVDPGGSSAYIGSCSGNPDSSQEYSTLKALVGTSWLQFVNRNGDTTCECYNVVWPYITTNAVYNGYGLRDFSGYWGALKANLDGSFPVFPLVMIASRPNICVFGELQGCYAVPRGVGNPQVNSEDTITIDGDTYIVFQNTYRTTQDEYWALKLE